MAVIKYREDGEWKEVNSVRLTGGSLKEDFIKPSADGKTFDLSPYVASGDDFLFVFDVKGVSQYEDTNLVWRRDSIMPKQLSEKHSSSGITQFSDITNNISNSTDIYKLEAITFDKETCILSFNIEGSATQFQSGVLYHA